MIIPFEFEFRKWEEYPVTMSLAVTNIVVFLLFFRATGDDFGGKFFDDESLKTTGRIYFQYLGNLRPEQLYQKPEWLHRVQPNSSSSLQTLAITALRDAEFVQSADRMEFAGDQVVISKWKNELREFRASFLRQMVFSLGLSRMDQSPFAWITYQFSHAGWLHLISNLCFIVLIGAATEATVGGLALLVIYLCSGILGGLFFLIFNGSGLVPVVGASASVSGLLAFYALAASKRRIRYFYFITPLPGHFGEIFLHPWLIFPLFLVVDIAQLLSSPDGLGPSVAYSAHVGGALAGILAYVWSRSTEVFRFHHN